MTSEVEIASYPASFLLTEQQLNDSTPPFYLARLDPSVGVVGVDSEHFHPSLLGIDPQQIHPSLIGIDPEHIQSSLLGIDPQHIHPSLLQDPTTPYMVANSTLYSFLDYAPQEEEYEGLAPTKEYGEVESIPARPEQVQLDHSYAIKSPPPSLLLEEEPPSTPDSSSLDTEETSAESTVGSPPGKPRRSPIKYIVGDGSRSSRREEGSSKLESLLKAPIRRPGRSTPPALLNSLLTTSDDLDILTPPTTLRINYDGAKARNLMNECEKFVNFARPNDVPDNWESMIVKTGWTRAQRSLFEQTLRALHRDHLARASFVGNPAEPVLRRLQIDTTSARIRNILTRISWDSKLTQWLHGVLKDNLSWEYLAAYMDVLQTLRSKVPTLIDRMILLSTSTHHSIPSSSSHCSLVSQQSAEALNLLLKRQWDPFATVLKQTRLKKTRFDPLFLFVPHSPFWSSPVSPRRSKAFCSMLGVVGKPITTPMNPSNLHNLSVDEYAEKMLTSTRQKLQEVKSSHPDRPVFLVGWGPGALLAARVSFLDRVAGLIFLGFPLITLDGVRGECEEDQLLRIQYPTLFVVGSRARNGSPASLDALRALLPCNSSLIVIKDGDEYLNVRRSKKRELLLTQTCIDKIVTEEIGSFITNYCIESMEAAVKEPRLVRSPGKVGRPASPRKGKNVLVGSQQLEEQMEMETAAPSPPPPSSSSPFEELYDEAKRIPSNQSSSRRKAYYRASSTCSTSAAPPSSDHLVHHMTASQLVQQQHGPAARVRNDSCEEPPPNGSLASLPPLVLAKSQLGRASSTEGKTADTNGSPSKTDTNSSSPPALVPTTTTRQQQLPTGSDSAPTIMTEPLLNGTPTTTTTSDSLPTTTTSALTHFNASELERLNSALMTKRATDLNTLLGSGKRVIIHKTLVKKSSLNGPVKQKAGETAPTSAVRSADANGDSAVAAAAVKASDITTNSVEISRRPSAESESDKNPSEVAVSERAPTQSETGDSTQPTSGSESVKPVESEGVEPPENELQQPEETPQTPPAAPEPCDNGEPSENSAKTRRRTTNIRVDSTLLEESPRVKSNHTNNAKHKQNNVHGNHCGDGESTAKRESKEGNEDTGKETNFKNLRSRKSSECNHSAETVNNLDGRPPITGKRKLSTADGPLKELDSLDSQPPAPKMRKSLKRVAGPPLARTTRKCV